jgi:hypothetical protein
MFVAKYPMCKPIGVEFLEYLVRTTTDVKLYEGAVASKNMVCGDWFTALPIGSFKNIMNSRNLLITLGVKGGYKKSNVKLFNETLPIKDRFWVVHNNGRRAGQHFVAGGPDVDKQSHQLIQKLRSKMSFFVSEQFNVFNEAEKSSVEKGFINDRDTIFILGLDNGAVYHIVGVVQFVATKHGAFITWLAVLHESPPQVYFNQNKSAIPSFRRLRMASFLQELVQLLLIARGWKPDLYLQSNVKSPSRNYYEHRGYVKAPSNSLSSVPGLTVEAFQSETINFVTDEIQVEHGIDESERLHLFYHEGPLKSSFLSPTDNSILPAADSDGVIEFPFNCSGNMIDRFTSGDNIFLMSETSFGAVAGVEYAVRDTANSASINQNMRETEWYADIYDGAQINLAQYNALSDTRTAMNDDHVDFFSSWLLRNESGAVAEDVAIVPIHVCKSFIAAMDHLNDKNAFENDPELHSAALEHISVVDKYLYGHPTLLQKRLIFITVDFEPESWLGFVAINPFTRLILYALEQCRGTPDHSQYWSPEDYVFGLIHNHSDKSAKPNEFDRLSVLWFLNLASRYRDLRLKKEHSLFNFEKMVLHGVPIFHFMLLGSDGPFGKLYKLDKEDDYVYPLLEQDPRSGFYSKAADCQGSSAWCLFVYDTILSVNGRSLKHADMVVPFLGLYCHSDHVLKTDKPLNADEATLNESLYLLLRAEMRITIERLRFLYLDNGDIDIPHNWGGVSEAHTTYLSRPPFTTLVQPLLTRNQKFRIKKASSYKEEKQYRLNMMDSAYETLTDTAHILQSPKLAMHCLREEMFSEDLIHLALTMTTASQKPEQWVAYLMRQADIVPAEPARLRGKPDPPYPVAATTTPVDEDTLPIKPITQEPSHTDANNAPSPITVAASKISATVTQTQEFTQPRSRIVAKAPKKQHMPGYLPAKRRRNEVARYQPQGVSRPAPKPRRGPSRNARNHAKWSYLPEAIVNGLTTNVMPEAVLHYSKAKDTRTDHDLEHPHKDDLLASVMTDGEWPVDNNIPHRQTD